MADRDSVRTPRNAIETWFKVAISAFVPIIAAFLLPASFKFYCLAAAGLLMLTAIIVLIRQERANRSSDDS